MLLVDYKVFCPCFIKCTLYVVWMNDEFVNSLELALFKYTLIKHESIYNGRSLYLGLEYFFLSMFYKMYVVCCLDE